MEVIKIKDNFFDLGQELVDSKIKTLLEPIREDFKIEIGGPGCTPCKMNAAKRKYGVIIDNLMAQSEQIVN